MYIHIIFQTEEKVFFTSYLQKLFKNTSKIKAQQSWELLQSDMGCHPEGLGQSPGAAPWESHGV